MGQLWRINRRADAGDGKSPGQSAVFFLVEARAVVFFVDVARAGVFFEAVVRVAGFLVLVGFATADARFEVAVAPFFFVVAAARRLLFVSAEAGSLSAVDTVVFLRAALCVVFSP